MLPPQLYKQHSSLYETLSKLKQQPIQSLISTIDQYQNWLKNSFISNIRAQQWCNGEALKNLSSFINDKSHRVIDKAIMTQLYKKISFCQNTISIKT
ncbi:unnamed protein product [Adineta steineri]|uniref:Uncharacterized protein n=1 Tax=Adineta steineri TaxID=433720 RepID=A0A819I7P8_9BILA|nr:unnamed protein product [Adineta steineri]